MKKTMVVTMGLLLVLSVASAAFTQTGAAKTGDAQSMSKDVRKAPSVEKKAVQPAPEPPGAVAPAREKKLMKHKTKGSKKEKNAESAPSAPADEMKMRIPLGPTRESR
ncbi:MAG: hypothetical protein HY742_02215 [Deltaproteobacteria bacterium]|nr:hypothetical protein [Deltaproteobacteria bacterium]